MQRTGNSSMKKRARVDYSDVKENDAFSTRRTDLPRLKPSDKTRTRDLSPTSPLPRGTAKKLRLTVAPQAKPDRIPLPTAENIGQYSKEALRGLIARPSLRYSTRQLIASELMRFPSPDDAALVLRLFARKKDSRTQLAGLLPEHTRVAVVRLALEQILQNRTPGSDWPYKARGLLRLLSDAQKDAVMQGLLVSDFGDVIRRNKLLPKADLKRLDQINDEFAASANGVVPRFYKNARVLLGRDAVDASTARTLLALAAYPDLQSYNARAFFAGANFKQLIRSLRQHLYNDAENEAPALSGPEQDRCLMKLPGGRTPSSAGKKPHQALANFLTSRREAQDVMTAVDEGLSFTQLQDLRQLRPELRAAPAGDWVTLAKHSLARHSASTEALSNRWEKREATLRMTVAAIAHGRITGHEPDVDESLAKSPIQRLIVLVANETNLSFATRSHNAEQGRQFLERLKHHLEILMVEELEGQTDLERDLIEKSAQNQLTAEDLKPQDDISPVRLDGLRALLERPAFIDPDRYPEYVKDKVKELRARESVGEFRRHQLLDEYREVAKTVNALLDNDEIVEDSDEDSEQDAM